MTTLTFSLLILHMFLNQILSTPFCENAKRENVQFYFDSEHRMCLAYRNDCISRTKINEQFHDTEEQCTLQHMQTVWKSVKIRCPTDLRMAIFRRSNGDKVPILFSSQLCHDDGFSDMCEVGETCNVVGWLGFCCSDEAFFGEGPSSGLFNITGIGGPVLNIIGGSLPDTVQEAPINCNEDGDRNEVEWYRSPSGTGCVSQRIHCTIPKFGRRLRRDVFPDEQSCMDFWFPGQHFTRVFDCEEDGYAAVLDNDAVTPLVFESRLCGSPHDSDYCNRDEFCTLTDDKDVAFCCRRSADEPFKYSQIGRVGEVSLSPRDSFDFTLTFNERAIDDDDDDDDDDGVI